MDRERWKQVDNLLLQALERPAEERETFLRSACAGDDGLHREVKSLLAKTDQAGSFLESPAIEVAAESLAKDELFSNSRNPELESGAMIAHYRVTAKLGEGGMGEVYRARDTKLHRDVALKILPGTMARDAKCMARFQREARVLASLNHPNIAAIHGLEESNGILALVMELVEGQTLGERLGRTHLSAHAPSPEGRGWSSGAGPGEGSRSSSLVVEEALPIAKQIAEALEYAHERGVIHRDLKPANVKITPEGTVKVLDFGLAKVLSPQDSSATMDMADSPTLSAMATQAGMILGTAAYMSPEQAKGQRVDRRCDIWAFGCVMFEMLSGRKPFDGETISDVLAAVIRAEPDWEALPATTPLSIQRLIRRCLQKDQRQRLQAIGDARIAIEETISGTDSVVAGGVYPGGAGDRRPSIQEESGANRAPLQRALPWALAGVLAVVAAIFAIGYVSRAPKPQPVIRFPVAPPENTTLTFGGEPRLSPDGRHLAFVAQAGSSSPPVLWVRSLDALTDRPIQGTNGVNLPFWSPDGHYLGFYADGKLEKVSLSGGRPQVLCKAVGVGATWSKNGVIVFTELQRLFRVPDTGGVPTLVAAPDRARHERGYRFPQFLPDGRHFLFLIAPDFSTPTSGFSIAIGSLDSKKVERLSATSSNAFYAPPGYLLYMDQTTLMARPFDATGLKFTGHAVPIAENVGRGGIWLWSVCGFTGGRAGLQQRCGYTLQPNGLGESERAKAGDGWATWLLFGPGAFARWD
jgi:serine/threonine protein kinase